MIENMVGIDLHALAQRHPERAEKNGIWLLAIGQTIGYAGLYYVFSGLLFFWEDALSWGKERLTLGLMLAVITSALVSPFAGRRIDRGQGRWLLCSAMFGGTCALAATGFVTSYPLFLLCWILIGAAQGMCLYDPCFAFVTRTTGDKARRYITRITLVAGFASTMAFPSAAFLAESLSWQAAIWVFAAILALVGAPCLYAGATLIECCPHRASNKTADKARYRNLVKDTLRQPAFWLLFTAFPLIGLTEGLILTHIIPILADAGLATANAVFVASLFGPMQVTGRVLMMRSEGKLRAHSIAILSFGGILGAALLLKQINGSLHLAIIFACLFGASYGLISILRPVLAAETLGKDRFGAMSGWIAMPFLASVALSPQLGSGLWQIGGYTLAITVAAMIGVLALAAILCLPLVTRRQR